MNRIILIGNGFDLAHGLETKYTDFVNSYWTDFAKRVVNQGAFTPYKDELAELRFFDSRLKSYQTWYSSTPITSYSNFADLIKNNRSGIFEVEINKFFKHISERAYLQNWVDIESEYYTLLKDFLKIGVNRSYAKQWPAVKDLNDEFCQVKNVLEEYLTKACEKYVEQNKTLLEHLFLKNGIARKDVALSKQVAYDDSVPSQKNKLLDLTYEYIRYENEQMEHKKIQAIAMGKPYVRNPLCDMTKEELERETEQSIERMGIDPDRILVLNFNYTATFKNLYDPNAELDIINIHGELNNPKNPIVFGYGDELDEDYRKIESANANDMLENVKSVAYGNQDNYRRLLEFLQLGQYQVFVMGHSCGNSDRTLLNEIFENQNCISVKLFYHKRSDGSDDFSNVYKNISRNFNNKRALRDIVVNKTFCEPMPQNETAQKQE